MKEMPTDDPLFGKGTIRVDGRKIHPAYLVEVKKPSGVEGDRGIYYKVRATIPADQAFRPLKDGRVPAGQVTRCQRARVVTGRPARLKPAASCTRREDQRR